MLLFLFFAIVDPNPVSSLEITNITLTSLIVRWTDPEVTGDLELIFGGYVLSYTMDDGADVDVGFLGKGTNFYIIDDVYPTTNFNVSIRTRMGSGETQEYSSFVIETATKVERCI